MSRIGRLPVVIPAGVTVNVTENNVVVVKGPLGELSQKVDKNISVAVEGTEVHVTRHDEQKEHKAMHGLYRKLIANMVEGVTKGFQKALIVNGVGYEGFLFPLPVVGGGFVVVFCGDAHHGAQGADNALIGDLVVAFHAAGVLHALGGLDHHVGVGLHLEPAGIKVVIFASAAEADGDDFCHWFLFLSSLRRMPQGKLFLIDGPGPARPRTPCAYFLCEQKVGKKSLKPAV